VTGLSKASDVLKAYFPDRFVYCKGCANEHPTHAVWCQPRKSVMNDWSDVDFNNPIGMFVALSITQKGAGLNVVRLFKSSCIMSDIAWLCLALKPGTKVNVYPKGASTAADPVWTFTVPKSKDIKF
jgi:hypothetical protein